MVEKETPAPVTARPVFLSVVCVVHDAQAYVEARLKGLAEVLSTNYKYYEVVIVDNASSDSTGLAVLSVLRTEKNIHYCSLSSRVNRSIALTAGLERAIGDFVVCLDLAVDPPKSIPALVDIALKGAEIVYALPLNRLRGTSTYDRMARWFVRWIAEFNGLRAPDAMSTLRVFSRTVLTFILASADCHRIIALAPALSGYSYASYEYERMPPPSGEARRIGLNSVFESLELTFTTSVRPLRVISLMALGLSIASVIYALYVVLVRLFQHGVAPGWATLSLQVSLSFFVISIVLGVMCEYLLQTLEATKRRPVYHIARESHSSVIDLRQDPNVETRSEGLIRSAAKITGGFSAGDRARGNR